MKTAVAAAALVSATFSLPAIAAYSSDGLWQDAPYILAGRSGAATTEPDEYRLVQLDPAALERKLAGMQARSTEESGIAIDLPLPDGSFERFELWPSDVLAPELAEKYPEILSFEGRSLERPEVWGRFDWTPLGFHGYLVDGEQTVYINPRTEGQRTLYLSFFRDRMPLNIDPALFGSDVRHPPLTLDRGETTPTKGARTERSYGSQYRTYRLAVAATGEYTLYHGGTVALGLAAVTTAVNRVAGIYQQDLAVKLQLVANNDQIIYTNPATDPYTNGNADLIVDQNITNLDNVIGNSAYDIGHVVSTGAGGLSYLGVVCDDWYKGGGATGNSSPTGDPFWVDYVAHEMGHQFGADHTYNGTQGSCGPERVSTNAYEPGSGSTIMGYAGICDSDDLQANSDAYFHTASLDQIQDYLGNYGGCAAYAASGNTPPVVSAGSGGYTIPKSTPFSLTGSATDANGDSLTYAWEEYDLGPAGSPSSPSGTAPTFRSWFPSASPTRYFPRLSDLLNGTSAVGELLPSYDRTLNFRLTARDGKGGVDSKQLTSPLTVTSLAGPFTVVQPSANATYNGGASLTVTWNVANTAASPVSCSQVNIALWSSPSYTLATGTANDGSATLQLPDADISNARVLVACSNNIFFNISPGAITVKKNTQQSNITLSSLTIAPGTPVAYVATSTITTSGSVIVQSGASLTLQAPVVRLTAGFHAMAGSTVTVGQ